VFQRETSTTTWLRFHRQLLISRPSAMARWMRAQCSRENSSKSMANPSSRKLEPSPHGRRERHNDAVSDAIIRRFSVSELHSALDTRRVDLDLSWKQLASELWDLSAELNDRRHDHPISPSTLTNMAKRQEISCQHALFMLRWLGRTPESFLVGASEGDGSHFALPLAGPDRRLRWALKLLWASMDEQRREVGLTWVNLAGRLECTSSQLTGLRTARFATGMRVAMNIVQWLERPAADFVYPAKW
jgi:hypothetical protein